MLRHGQQHSGGLCEDPHTCPGCESGGECVDLFSHPICGLVACDGPPTLGMGSDDATSNS